MTLNVMTINVFGIFFVKQIQIYDAIENYY